MKKLDIVSNMHIGLAKQSASETMFLGSDALMLRIDKSIVQQMEAPAKNMYLFKVSVTKHSTLITTATAVNKTGNLFELSRYIYDLIGKENCLTLLNTNVY